MPYRTHFLTPEGKRKLEAEVEYLRTVRRKEVAVNLKSAIEDGDLSENAGYEEAKREQAFVEGRILDVEAILGNARVLEESDGQGDLVAVGSRVLVVEEGQSDPEAYHIVGPAEADPAAGRISNESPLGRQLLGRRIGDKISVDTPGGVLYFEILSFGQP